jgi:hypothetical protein
MGSGDTAPSFLTSVPDEDEWSASHPGRFTRGERFPGTHWIGGWLGPSVGLDDVERGEIMHYRETNPGRPARSPSLYRLSNPDSIIITVVI